MDYDSVDIAEEKQMNAYCTHCYNDFVYFAEDIITKHHGTYDAQITTCPYCNRIVIVSTEEDANLDINNDPRYYA